MPLPALPIIIGTAISGLLTTLGGVSVGFDPDGSNTAHEAVKRIELLEGKTFVVLKNKPRRDRALELDEIGNRKLFRHPDDRNGDGDLDEDDCEYDLIKTYGVDWRVKKAGIVDDLLHSCHDHYDSNPRSPGSLKPVSRRRRDVSEEGKEEEELLFEIDLPLPEQAVDHGGKKRKKNDDDNNDGPAIMLTPTAAVVVLEEEEDSQGGSPWLTNICRHVSEDPSVSIIVLVGVVLLGAVELLAMVVCGMGWLRGCRVCMNKCTESRQQFCDA